MDAVATSEKKQPSLLKGKPQSNATKKKRAKSRKSRRLIRRTLELRPMVPPAPARAKSNNHLKVESINLRASSGRVVSTRRCTASTVAAAKPPEIIEIEEIPVNDVDEESVQSQAQQVPMPAHQ